MYLLNDLAHCHDGLDLQILVQQHDIGVIPGADVTLVIVDANHTGGGGGHHGYGIWRGPNAGRNSFFDADG